MENSPARNKNPTILIDKNSNYFNLQSHESEAQKILNASNFKGRKDIVLLLTFWLQGPRRFASCFPSQNLKKFKTSHFCYDSPNIALDFN
jgi:hypothetical protein